MFDILGYLQGENDKREKIMSNGQYDLIITHVQSYIKTNQIPEIPVKIEPLNLIFLKIYCVLLFTFFIKKYVQLFLKKNLYVF